MDGKAQRLNWFNDESLKLEVPFFQRPYVWNADNWGTLLNSIMKEQNNRMPFIGSFIFQKTSNENRILVIDGQQRITTLSVLIKAYLDIFKCKLSPNAITNLKNIIYDSELAEMMEYIDTPRLIPSNSDKDGFNLVMKETIEADELEKSNDSIVNCYKYFLSKLSVMSETELKILGNKILTKNNFFIAIILDPRYDDEQEIFDSVNSLGQRLTCSDIIKNYLYQSMKLKVNNDETFIKEIMRLYASTWEKVFYESDKKDFWYEVRTLGRISTNNLEAFLKDYGAIKGIYRASENGGMEGLATSYKKYLDNLTYEELKNFTKELSSYAQKYYDLHTSFEAVNDFRINDRLNTTLLILDKLEHTTFNPYILKLVKDNPIDIDDRLFSLQKFVLTRLIYGASTKNYNKVAEGLLESDNPNQYLKSYNDNDSNIDFSSYPIGLSFISGRNNKYATLILFIIEMIRRNKVGEDLYLDTLMYSNKSLEHIIPQKWRGKWTKVPCYDYNDFGEYEQVTDIERLEKIRDKKVYSIGNMTILTGKLNSSISNEIFEVKIDGKKGKSNGIRKFVGSLSIAKEIVDLYDLNGYFDERTINEREEKLFNELNEYYSITSTYNANKIPSIAVIDERKEEINVLKLEMFTEEYFNNTKIGKLVRETILYLFENSLLSEEEIALLKDKEYCRKATGCAFAILVINEQDTYDSMGRSRFYKEKYKYQNQEYYLCKEWFENDKKYFVPWIKNKIGLK